MVRGLMYEDLVPGDIVLVDVTPEGNRRAVDAMCIWYTIIALCEPMEYGRYFLVLKTSTMGGADMQKIPWATDGYLPPSDVKDEWGVASVLVDTPERVLRCTGD